PARPALQRGLTHPRLPHGRAGARIVLLATLAGAPVGAGSLFRAAGQGWVTNIGTVPAARGRGVGAAMTQACLRLATERGDPSAWLAASPMGAPLYARLGFRAAGRIDHLVGPTPR
ncbi:MAG: GNAT family N-acetyltransferase, partial [Chloroflexota bacterium]